jgi:plastocyanin
MRSAFIAAGLGAATATMLAAVVLPGWAQNASQANADAVSIDNFTFGPQTLTVKARTTVT